jgi:hypothetical protein
MRLTAFRRSPLRQVGNAVVARQLAEALVHVAQPQRFDAAAEQADTLAARAGGGGGGGGKRTGRAGSNRWNSGGHVRAPRASGSETAEAPATPILRVSVSAPRVRLTCRLGWTVGVH